MRGPAVLGARFDTNQSVPQGRYVFPDYVITLPLCWGSRQGVVGDGVKGSPRSCQGLTCAVVCQLDNLTQVSFASHLVPTVTSLHIHL